MVNKCYQTHKERLRKGAREKYKILKEQKQKLRVYMTKIYLAHKN